MSKKLRELGVIDAQQAVELSKWIDLRDKVINESYTSKKDEAVEIVKGIEIFVNNLKAIDPHVVRSWWKILNERDRRILTQNFLKKLKEFTDSYEKRGVMNKKFKVLDIFEEMGLHAFSEVIVPMIVLNLRTQGYVNMPDKDHNHIIITNEGRAADAYP